MGSYPPATAIVLRKISPFAQLPTRATTSSAGLDLFCPYNITIPPGERLQISTDLELIAVPPGSYLRIASRSSLALKHSLDVCGGVIDADYRGIISVILANQGKKAYHIKAGDRFAQMICERYFDTMPVLVSQASGDGNASIINCEVRGARGFGSSGN